MKPQNLLQTDLLDILFLGRNKAYGAYELRKHYDGRLLKSFFITILLCVLITFLNYFNSRAKNNSAALNIPVLDFEIFDVPEPPKKPEVKPAASSSKIVASKIYTIPKIVNDDFADRDISEISELDNNLIGTMNHEGDQLEKGDIMTSPTRDEGNKAEIPAAQPEAIEAITPLVKAEVMPEFPGGMEAFKKFMLRHLRQPELDMGERIVVRLQFVVDATGAINNIKVIQSGGQLDAEVIRVVGKMPKWKPGLQNGRSVPVYFTLPVTFLGESL